MKGNTNFHISSFFEILIWSLDFDLVAWNANLLEWDANKFDIWIFTVRSRKRKLIIIRILYPLFSDDTANLPSQWTGIKYNFGHTEVIKYCLIGNLALFIAIPYFIVNIFSMKCVIFHWSFNIIQKITYLSKLFYFDFYYFHCHIINGVRFTQ